MKKMLSIILTLLLIFTMMLPASAASVQDFSDVSSGAWYYGAIDYVTSKNLFNGTGTHTFSPGKPMTRAMFVTVLGRSYGVDPLYGNRQSTPFTDVTQADYFYPYTVWGYDNDLVSGVGNMKFNPNSDITREQMAAILYRYAALVDADTSFTDTDYFAFPDANTVSGFATDAMKWAVSHKIITGSSGKLNPKGIASRAQVAQIFMNADGILNKTETPQPPIEPTDPPEKPVEPTDPTPTPTPEQPTSYTRPTGKSQVDADGGYYDYDLSNEIMDLINDLRADEGIDPIEFHPTIQGWSEIRANEFRTLWDKYGSGITPEQGHKRLDGRPYDTVGYFLHGENLSGGYEFNAQHYVDRWYNSPGHKANILDSSFKIGSVSCYIQGNKVTNCHLFSTKTIKIFNLANG